MRIRWNRFVEKLAEVWERTCIGLVFWFFSTYGKFMPYRMSWLGNFQVFGEAGKVQNVTIAKKKDSRNKGKVSFTVYVRVILKIYGTGNQCLRWFQVQYCQWATVLWSIKRKNLLLMQSRKCRYVGMLCVWHLFKITKSILVPSIQGYELDGHNLELKMSNKKQT